MNPERWVELYRRYFRNALCVDIETQYFNGPIAIVGLYKPRDGEMICDQYIYGKNLNQRTLREAFKDCKLLITYNGMNFDVRKIMAEFPGALPDQILVLDVYLLARELGLGVHLKALETTLRIERLDPATQRQGIALKLWSRYWNYRDGRALNTLLEYNKQDTINLYPIAEELIRLIEMKMR